MKKIYNKITNYDIPSDYHIIDTSSETITWKIFVSASEFEQSLLIELLNRILTALNIKINENGEIIKTNPKLIYTIPKAKNQKSCKIICFGILPEQLQLQGFNEKYFIYHFQNNTFLFVDNLVNYSNESSKKILWNALKKMKENEA
ncbi:MAG: hypothetical protein WAR77_05190 [Saprospiraceae bacterium]|nr:hypothetical protein [Saprospiraceae bacterium]